MDLLHRPAWMADAACRGLREDLNFFPALGESTARAKALCARCSVREQCLDYALADDSLQGVWGGTSARERARYRKGRPPAA